MPHRWQADAAIGVLIDVFAFRKWRKLNAAKYIHYWRTGGETASFALLEHRVEGPGKAVEKYWPLTPLGNRYR
jgi:hypothetical protein